MSSAKTNRLSALMSRSWRVATHILRVLVIDVPLADRGTLDEAKEIHPIVSNDSCCECCAVSPSSDHIDSCSGLLRLAHTTPPSVSTIDGGTVGLDGHT